MYKEINNNNIHKVQIEQTSNITLHLHTKITEIQNICLTSDMIGDFFFFGVGWGAIYCLYVNSTKVPFLINFKPAFECISYIFHLKKHFCCC